MKTDAVSIKMDDGMPIYVHRWIPDGEVKGVVQLFHGMVEHALRYDRFGSILAENGYVLVADDHRGHGQTARDAEWNSNGKFGYLSDGDGFERVVQDELAITAKIKEDFPGKKIVILGHSFGSFIAQAYMEKGVTDISGFILSGTAGPRPLSVFIAKCIASISCFFHGRYHISRTINTMIFGSYNKKIENPETPNDWLTRDKMIVQLYMGDLWCGFVPTISFFKDLFSGLLKIGRYREMENIVSGLPVFVMYGDEDPVGCYGKSVQKLCSLYKKLDLKLDVKSYSGARHELLNETCREEVENDILSWINERMK